jgi:aminodeoxyfutalosine synthase
MLADEARRRRNGDLTTFLRVADVPVATCDEVNVPAAAGEIRVIGDGASLEKHIERLHRLARRVAPVPVTAGSLDLLEASAGSTGALMPLLRALRDAGVEAIADAAVDRLAAPDASVSALKDTGLGVARFTLDGPPAGPWDVLERVRRLQASTGAVRTFAPLPRRQDPAAPTTGYADVKIVALARLVLDTVPSIQVDWSLHGPKLAQVALLFGADDVDAVSPEQEVGTGRRRAPLEEILRNIRAASLTPVERDGRFDRRSS